MYPDGWGGLGLLLLRIATTIALIVGPGDTYQNVSGWYLWGLIPLGAALCGGFLTRTASLVAVGVQVLRFAAPAANTVCLLVTILNTLTLAIIGPGAYSLDALVFGRRRVMSNRKD
jgi:uncharacterized membrane protein YphA (DoxX/SURF4 family)